MRRWSSGRSPPRSCAPPGGTPWRILAVSIVVCAVTVAAELAADHLLDRRTWPRRLAGSLSASAVSLLGAVFLSGFLSRLVSETGHGEHDAHGTRIRDVLRSLPWGSLILADLLAALIIVVGLLALIIPGLVAITLLAVVGPVIEIEHRHAWAGLRRSAHLVRPHFWRVALYRDAADAAGQRHRGRPARPGGHAPTS